MEVQGAGGCGPSLSILSSVLRYMLILSGCGYVWFPWQQVSESGVHRPHVAGIHGRENEGAYSIVLSGGYEDDKVS